jgi:putative PIN family toxin of toxin-antitoxin system
MNLDRHFIFDNNVLVSAFLFKNSTPRHAFDLALSLGVIVRSEETLNELWEVLVRPKFDRFLPIADRITLLKAFEKITIDCAISTTIELCRDPKDDKFLSLAISAQAESITTGDKDLLVLSEIFSIPIYTPANFITMNMSF